MRPSVTEPAGPGRAPPVVGAEPSRARRLLTQTPIHVVLIGVMVLWSLPTIALLVSSFRTPQAITASGWWNAFVTPNALTLSNYIAVLEQQGMARSFVNTVVITVPATLLVIFVAALAAYAFAWMDFPGRRLLFLSMVALLVIPLQMTLIPVLRLYTQTTVDVALPVIGGRVWGVGSIPALWVAHTAYGLPFAIYLLRNFFAGLPKDIIESARLYGASDWLIFRRIVIPLSVPAIAALAIFQFLWTWNDLLVALVLLGGEPSLAPMTVTINSLVSSFGSEYQVLTAAAFVSMAVPLLLFFALQRYFVQGILAGAVKG